MIVWPSTPRMPASFVALRDFLLEVVHVVCSVVPGLQHLERARRRVPTRTISGDTVFPSGRKDVLLEPVHQHEVVGQAAVHDHGGVAMRR